MKWKVWLLLMSVLLFLVHCSSDMDDTAKDITLMDIQQEQNHISADTTFQNDHGQPSQKIQKTITEKQYEWDKKIIKTATLNAEVKNFNNFSDQLHDKVKRSGGYIAQEEQNQDAYKIENIITAKIPVTAFSETITDILSGVENINQKQIRTDDITAEYVDGKSRLEAKKQVRLRYLQLLKQAKNMQEILSVQNEINDIQEEIEAVTGRLNYLAQSSAMSTIHFTYYQILDASINDGSGTSFLARINNAFSNGWHWLGLFIVGLISIWPLLFIGIIFLLLFRKKIFRLS